jgi:OmpA-OmpF porin, OOP family
MVRPRRKLQSASMPGGARDAHASVHSPKDLKENKNMKKKVNRKLGISIPLVLGGLAAAGLLLGAQANAAEHEDVVGNKAYVVGQTGLVVRNQFGDCWRSSQWSEELAIKACDPHLFPERAEAPPPAEPTPPPAPPPAPRQVEEVRTLDAGALFAINSAAMSDAGKAELDVLIRDVKALDNVERITVVGHTDSTGAADYNMDLSKRRAESVKAYMVEQGIDASLITTEGRGLTQPVASNDTTEGRRQNRRVEIIVRGSDMVTR